MSESKAHNTFVNRVLHFDDDIEFMDIVCRHVARTDFAEDDKIFKCFDVDKHPNIARHIATQHSRKLIANHCKATLYASYVKDIYEEFSEYLRSIIAEAFDNAKISPERIAGGHETISMTLKDILKFQMNGTLTEIIIGRIFQALENERSTIKLINKVCSKLGLTVDESIIQDAVYYLEIRHKLVHADGLADEDFRKSHQGLTYTNDSHIDLTYDTIISLKKNVTALVDAIDREALSKQILKYHTIP